ncbi:MAG TPA: hypothetical protein VIB79_02915 [Candidatus Binatia bacterium]|jgi:hypothetical protein
MGTETYKKRQKEMARREKQQKKAARRMERRNEQGLNRNKVADEGSKSDPGGAGGATTI